MALVKTTANLLKETVGEWMADGGSHIAAALAYYAIFSLSPLLIVVSLTLGLVMDSNTVATGLAKGLQATIGQQAAGLIGTMLENKARTTDVLGTIVWLAIVLWGASGMFAQLQNALNKIWEVKVKPGRSLIVLAKDRFLSFGIVILAAIALLGTMVINTAINAIADRGHLSESDVINGAAAASRTFSVFATGAPLSSSSLLILRVVQLLITVLVSTLLIAVVYRVLPDVDISWKDVAVGSIFTALLLFVGQFAVGLYLSHATVGSVFGAAGSLTVILVWVYYSAQLFFWGAEFCKVYTRAVGSQLRPVVVTGLLRKVKDHNYGKK